MAPFLYTKPLYFRTLVFSICFSFIPINSEANENHAHVTLFPDRPILEKADSSLTVGVHFEIDEGWHIYWKNPGDLGLPTSISWKLPSGLVSEEMLWPRPELFDENGVTTYGYSGNVTLLVPFSIDFSERDDSAIHLKADIRWLACKDICISESIQKNGQQVKPLMQLVYMTVGFRFQPGSDNRDPNAAAYGYTRFQ